MKKKVAYALLHPVVEARYFNKKNHKYKCTKEAGNIISSTNSYEACSIFFLRRFQMASYTIRGRKFRGKGR